MNIQKPWDFDDEITILIQDRRYNIHAAILLARDIEAEEVPIRFISRSLPAPCDDRLMDFAAHVKAVNDADLSYPILMSDTGSIIDGRHRLVKAMLEGRDTILCKQFEKDPAACYTLE